MEHNHTYVCNTKEDFCCKIKDPTVAAAWLGENSLSMTSLFEQFSKVKSTTYSYSPRSMNPVPKALSTAEFLQVCHLLRERVHIYVSLFFESTCLSCTCV
jgi:hypothetical protein